MKVLNAKGIIRELDGDILIAHDAIDHLRDVAK
jgi:hypothetical protein